MKRWRECLISSKESLSNYKYTNSNSDPVKSSHGKLPLLTVVVEDVVYKSQEENQLLSKTIT